MAARWHRWRRRLLIALGIWATLVQIVYVLRWTRDYPSVTPRRFLERNTPLVFAHRGASGYELEHTAAAYERALADGADVLELDVRRTRDGAVVLAHDATVWRLYGEPQLVETLTLDEMRALARTAGQAEPLTLEEVFADYPDTRFNIELKDESRELAEQVLGIIHTHRYEDKVLVASLHGAVLEHFRDASERRIATSAGPGDVARFYFWYLVGAAARPDYEALQVPASLGSSSWAPTLAQKSFVDFAHRHGLAVHFFTLDDERAIRRALEAGADGVMSNYPDRVRRIVRELAAAR